jgi:hypothetical protein
VRVPAPTVVGDVKVRIEAFVKTTGDLVHLIGLDPFDELLRVHLQHDDEQRR